MDRDIVRSQGDDTFQRMEKHGIILARKPCDDIRIDVRNPALSDHFKSAADFLHRMQTADRFQCHVVHGLRIYADPIHSIMSHYRQFLPGDRIRSAGFHAEFSDFRQIERFHSARKQSLQRKCAERSGGAASHIKAFRHNPETAEFRSHRLNLCEKSLKIPLHRFPGRLIGRKRTIKTPRRTERNPDVYSGGVFRRHRCEKPLVSAGL